MSKLFIIFFASIFTNNIILTYFLGICPFVALSKDLSSSIGMGFAVTFVMVLTAAINWPVNYFILVPYKVEYLQFAVSIMIIAVLVQVVEMLIDRFFPALYITMGVFLSLITVNCAILGVSLFMIIRNYNYIESIVFSLGCGLGWTLAIIALAGIRSRLIFANIPKPLEGLGISLIIAGIIAMGFMGFAGWITL